MIVMILSTDEVKELVNSINVPAPIHTEPTINISPAAADQMIKDAVADISAADAMKQMGEEFDHFIKANPVKVEPVGISDQLAKESDPVAEESAPAEEPQEEDKPVIKRSTVKRKLDDGKIVALRRAGWTWDRIADEMNCSIPTAMNHFNEYKKNLEG